MQTSFTIRLLILDNNTLMRREVRAALSEFGDFKIVGDAVVSEDRLWAWRNTQPHIALLGLDGRIGNCIHTIKSVQVHFPDVRIIVLCYQEDQESGWLSLQAGAASCLMRSVDSHTLADAIRNTQAGLSVIDQEVMQSLLPLTGREQGGDRGLNLTARESEILAMIVRGFSNTEISKALDISLSTTKYHISNLLVKMQVSTRVEATAIAITTGLVHHSLNI